MQPVMRSATGKMLDGGAARGKVAGAIGNWAEVKVQALEMLGIILTDFDVHDVPQLVTDQYGKFIPGAQRLCPLVMPQRRHPANNWYLKARRCGLTFQPMPSGPTTRS